MHSSGSSSRSSSPKSSSASSHSGSSPPPRSRAAPPASMSAICGEHRLVLQAAASSWRSSLAEPIQPASLRRRGDHRTRDLASRRRERRGHSHEARLHSDANTAASRARCAPTRRRSGRSPARDDGRRRRAVGASGSLTKPAAASAAACVASRACSGASHTRRCTAKAQLSVAETCERAHRPARCSQPMRERVFASAAARASSVWSSIGGATSRETIGGLAARRRLTRPRGRHERSAALLARGERSGAGLAGAGTGEGRAFSPIRKQQQRECDCGPVWLRLRTVGLMRELLEFARVLTMKLSRGGQPSSARARWLKASGGATAPRRRARRRRLVAARGVFAAAAARAGGSRSSGSRRARPTTRSNGG